MSALHLSASRKANPVGGVGEIGDFGAAITSWLCAEHGRSSGSARSTAASEVFDVACALWFCSDMSGCGL